MDGRVRWAAGLAALVALLVLLPSPAARAAGGTWGAGHYPYRAGLVCRSGFGSAPLVSWGVGGSGPGFLTAPLRSNGLSDSGAPPLASVGQQFSVPVTPGTDGFTSDADIATYAALLSGAGTSGSDATVAAIARAVMLHAGASGVPSCAGSAAGLLARARAQAGPYTISLRPATSPAVMGQPDTLLATVRGGSGRPVPGLRVRLSADGAQLAGGSAATGSDGTARVGFTVAPGSGLAQAVITATVTATTGLEEVSVLAAPTPTNPSGNSVPAIRPAAPDTVTATANVAIDQSAHPVVHVGADPPAVGVGAAVHPQASITGLRGHQASVTVTVRGPAPLNSAGTCSGTSSSAAVADTSGPVNVTGDRTVTVGSWTPATAGCYSLQAAVQTIDATPQATAASSLALVTVVASTARLSVPHPVVGAGALTATLTPAHTEGRPGQVSGALRGPLRPSATGSCTGLDWSHAANAAAVPASAAHGDRPLTLHSGAVRDAGCYAWTVRLVLDLGGLRVPIPAPPATVLLLRPTVSLTSDQTWSVSPKPIGTHVTVAGTYGQPAHVSIQMQYVAAPLTGCRAATWTQATLVSTGPWVAVHGDGDFAVRSGATPRVGCYQPVPALRIDANPSITATGSADVPDNAVIAGVTLADPDADPPETGPPGSSAGLWISGGVFGVAVFAVVAGAWVLARRERSGGREGGLELLRPMP
ncbi:MAG TPA: Ig-like domain-containing protein [Jatrophihabitans sp.]|nr:Ig-like domain-containing protein [Jatrophihabitans sp.]